MPKTIKNADGTEEEVFTAEDLATKAKEEADAATAKAEEEKEALRIEKEAELAKATDELEKLRRKDMNFENLRRGKEKGDVKENDLVKTVEDLQKQIQAITSAPIEEARAEFIGNNFKGQKELQDKFEVYYTKLSAGVKTRAEAQAAMEQAFQLAADGKKPNLGTQMQKASVDENFAGDGPAPESETSKGFGEKMGVSEEDKKKYGVGVKVDLIKPNVK